MTTRSTFKAAAGRGLGAAVIAFMTLGAPSSAHAEPEPASAPAAAAPAPPASEPAPPAATTEAPATKSGRTAWPWVIMGGGVALIVTAAVLEVHAVKEDDRREADETKLFSLPPGDPSRPELTKSAATHDDSAKSTRTGALVIGTVGFLAVAGSVILWFVEGGSSSSASSSAPSAKAKAKPSLLPSFGAGYAGASFGTSF